MPLGGGTIFSFIFHAFFYILQPLLLGNSLYRGAVYNALVLAVTSLRCPELPAFLARVAQKLQVRFRTGARAAEERLAPRACGAAPSTGPCEVTGPSKNTYAPTGGTRKLSAAL